MFTDRPSTPGTDRRRWLRHIRHQGHHRDWGVPGPGQDGHQVSDGGVQDRLSHQDTQVQYSTVQYSTGQTVSPGHKMEITIPSAGSFSLHFWNNNKYDLIHPEIQIYSFSLLWLYRARLLAHCSCSPFNMVTYYGQQGHSPKEGRREGPFGSALLVIGQAHTSLKWTILQSISHSPKWTIYK